MKNESGRTLVELISVLAIMAVLFITGIVAYNYAITKHKANELIHKANLGYVDIISRDNTPEWTELKTKQNNGQLLKGHVYNDVGYVWAKNVEQSVCNNIIKNLTDFTVLTTQNAPMTVCNDAQNDMIFDFGNTGSMEFPCESDGACFNGQICSTIHHECFTKEECTGATPYWNKNTEKCEACLTSHPDKPYYEDGECYTCVDKFLSPLKPYYDGNSCKECPSNTPKWDDIDACITCAKFDSQKPYWDSDRKECYTCLSDSHCGDDVCNFDTNTCQECTDTNLKNCSETCHNKNCVTCENVNSLAPYWDGNSCESCSILSATPVWSTAKHQCVECMTDNDCINKDKVCTNNNTCVTCAVQFPNIKPVWDDTTSQCVECLADSDCISKDKVCQNKQCVTCAIKMLATPVWDDKHSICVGCLSDSDCTAKSMACDTADTTCKSCLAVKGESAPAWNDEGNMCSTCKMADINLAYWNKTQQQCESCPTYSTTETIGKRIDDSDCYCVSPYLVNSAKTGCVCPANSTLNGPIKSNKIGNSDCYCNANKYWNGTACASCPTNSSSTVVSGQQVPNTTCYCNSGYELENGVCVKSCPANSSKTYVAGNIISGTNCYCNKGYVENGFSCATISSKCVNGRIVTGKVNYEKYCVSNEWFHASRHSSAISWCERLGMNIVDKDILCSNRPGHKETCYNFKGVDCSSACWVWTKEKYWIVELCSGMTQSYHDATGPVLCQ